jgi:hypothetical protein
MRQQPDLGRLLDAFYADGPTAAPDWILDDVLSRIGGTTQRVQWRASMRQSKAPTRRLLLIAAIVGTLIIASLALINLGAKPRRIAQSALPLPACLAQPNTCALGELAPGEHMSTAFATFAGKRHTLAYTVPAGWANTFDDDTGFLLRPPLDSQGVEMSVTASPVIMDQQEPCTDVPKPGVGESPEAMVAYIAGHPGLITGRPQRITVDGMPGEYIDVTGLRPDWTGTCIRYADGPVVMLMTQHTPGHFLYTEGPNQQNRFVFLDAGDGLTVVAIIHAGIPELFQPLIDLQMPVIQSFSIAR